LKHANRLLLVFGVALAVVSFVAVLSLGSFGRELPPVDPEVTVVTAAVDLPLGSQVAAEELATTSRRELVDNWGVLPPQPIQP
jgi:hypothetical protein